ncbi:MAG TPA: lamin tail domain-containing protein, partial [Patescibacteria group bacterium]|nr:lamin tail domain-containing protein [Patescibacteria group bacterium]
MFKRLSKKLSLMLAFILIMTSLLGFLTPTGVLAETVYAADLFLSEYIEGSSFNKAIEIFNGTDHDINLEAENYTLELYSNGSATASNTMNITGTLESGDVYVISHGSAVSDILSRADTTNSVVINFNGDDALVLKHNGVIIDCFGRVGEDPGSAWISDGVTTLDRTLVRKATVVSGDTIADDAFYPAIEWDSNPTNTYSNLGSHTMTGPVEQGPVAAVTATPQSGAVGIGTKVALECATEGATIMFATGDVVNLEFVEYVSGEQITLNSLPASIKAYATKDGQNGDMATFNYTQAQVATVIANPAAGAVSAGTPIVLSTTTAGADIFYGIGDNEIETPYVEPIIINDATSIKTIAKKDGFIDSVESSFIYTMKAPAEEMTIAEAKNQAPGTEVTVTGIVTSSGSSVFIQDNTAGINLFRKTTGDSIAEGDMVRVTGTVTVYNGLYELADYTIVKISSGNPLPEPQVITIAQISDEYQGELIKISNVTIGAINTAGNTTIT